MTRRKNRVEKKRAVRAYPARSLEEALRIAEAIKKYNGGNAWPPKDIAQAVGISAQSTNFQYLTSAARDYDITDGTSRSATIGLSPLGRRLVYADSETDEANAKIEAFFAVELFKRVFDHYRGSALPEPKYLKNTLVDKFGIPEDYHQNFLELFQSNCRFTGITTSSSEASSRDGLPSPDHATTHIVGRPAKDTGLKAFVIMPFVEHHEHRAPGFFAELLNSLIEPAGTGAGFVVKTANRQGSDLIQSTIINELLDADLVIADLTDHNPNVMFELGLRLADRKKPVALIKSNDTGKLFDVDNMMRVYEYNPNLWPSTIKEDIEKLMGHIKATWEGRETNPSYIDILRRVNS